MGTAVCNSNNDIRPGETVHLEKITPSKLRQFWGKYKHFNLV